VPKTLKSGEARKVAAKLLTSGLVREIKAKPGKEIWRRDEKIGQAYSLKLTAAGLGAIAADKRVSRSVPGPAVPKNTNEESSKKNTGANTVAACTTTAAATWPALRQGTKIARVVELLQRDQGVRLDELIAATGWLPHTARAALTGLRHRGYDVRLERDENGVPRSTALYSSSLLPRGRDAIERELGAAAEGIFGR
jgi:Protein of unknown function (DUF3489)